MANRINIVVSAQDEASGVIKNVANNVSAATKQQAAEARAAADQFKSNFDFIGTAAKAASAAVVGAGVGLTGFGLKSATELQVTAASFRALTGDAKVAKDLFASLYDFARGTPFAFPDVAAAGKTLLGYGRTAQQVKSDIQTLGGMVATTGADWQRLAVVYGQVNAAGKLYSQDALQLIENGVPIVTALAKQFGISITDVKAKMEDGAITADDFNRAMKSMVPADAIEQMSNTMTGRLSGLTGSIRSLAFSLVGIDYSKFDEGAPLLVKQGGLFDRITRAVQDFAKALSDPQLKAAAAQLGDGLASVVENGGKILVTTLKWLAGNLDTVRAGLLAAGSAFAAFKLGTIVADFALLAAKAKTFSGVMAAMGWNPWILAVTGLVTAFVFLQDRIDILGKAWDATKKAANWAREAYENVANFIKGGFESAVKVGSDVIDQLGRAVEACRDWFLKHEDQIRAVATVLSVVFGPALVRAAGIATLQGAKIAASGVASGAGWVKGSATATAAWAVNSAKMLVLSAAIYAGMAVDAAKSGVAWLVSSTKAAAAWVVSSAKMIASATAAALVMAIKAADAGWAWVFNSIRVSLAWSTEMAKVVVAASVTSAKSVAHAAVAGGAWVAHAAVSAIAWVVTELPKIVVGFAVTSGAAVVQAARSSGAWVAAAAASAIAWVVTELPKVVMAFFVTSGSAILHAAIAGGAWVTQAAVAATAWVVTQLPRIIAAFLATSGAAIAQAAVAAGAWVASAGTASAAFTAFSALVATPIVMPAIAIGAALLAIQQVWNAYNEMMAAIEGAKRSQEANNRAGADLRAVADKQFKAGKIDQKEKDRLYKVSYNALGTAYSPGGPTIVGEHGPELVNMPRGAQVTQNYRTRRELGGNSRTPEIKVTQHIYNQLDFNQAYAELGFRLRGAW